MGPEKPHLWPGVVGGTGSPSPSLRLPWGFQESGQQWKVKRERRQRMLEADGLERK